MHGVLARGLTAEDHQRLAMQMKEASDQIPFALWNARSRQMKMKSLDDAKEVRAWKIRIVTVDQVRVKQLLWLMLFH